MSDVKPDGNVPMEEWFAYTYHAFDAGRDLQFAIIIRRCDFKSLVQKKRTITVELLNASDIKIRLDTLEEATILYRRIADKFGARE